MPRAGGHLDNWHHERPVGSQVNPFPVDLQVLDINGVKKPFPEIAKVLPNVAVPPPWIVQVTRPP